MTLVRYARYLSFMSPGRRHGADSFLRGEYHDSERANIGGGVEDEEIEVISELPFSRALEMVRSGEIRDGKTVLLRPTIYRRLI